MKSSRSRRSSSSMLIACSAVSSWALESKRCADRYLAASLIRALVVEPFLRGRPFGQLLEAEPCGVCQRHIRLERAVVLSHAAAEPPVRARTLSEVVVYMPRGDT